MANTNLELSDIGFGIPIPAHPFYHIKVALKGVGEPAHVVNALFDQNVIRDIWVYNGDVPSPSLSIMPDAETWVVVRVNWMNGIEHSLQLELETDNGQRVRAAIKAVAPQAGGYWHTNWEHYVAYVLAEQSGKDRSNEPVHLLVSTYADTVGDPNRELRVVAVDPVTGVSAEVPSQVYDISAHLQAEDEGALPTITFAVAFLADVAANSERVYLLFFGNANADAPVYESDLVITGEGLNLIIENSQYRVKLHPKSGQLDEILLKRGVDALFDHHIETNGALHWNPDVYAPPRIWSHASDWDPPANVATTSGPIFYSIQRWGELPEYPDVLCSVTYTFYAHQPWFIMESVTDILADMDVRALRNGELVINLNVAREYAWREPSGRICTVQFVDRPQEPRRAVDIPARSPWWAFFNREKQAALAAVILDSSAYRREGGLARSESYITLKWGDWAYCVRPLAYTYNSQNPQRLVNVPASSSFSERIAFLPIRLGTEDANRFSPIEEEHQRLTSPLSVGSPESAVDDRTPPEWGVTFPYPYA